MNDNEALQHASNIRSVEAHVRDTVRRLLYNIHGHLNDHNLGDTDKSRLIEVNERLGYRVVQGHKIVMLSRLADIVGLCHTAYDEIVKSDPDLIEWERHE